MILRHLTQRILAFRNNFAAKIRVMVVAERDNLIAVKTIISNSLVHLILFENKEGNLFLSSRTSDPEGTVYYATTPSLFCMFLENQIDLQTLFDNSPSVFVELNTIDETSLYSRNTFQIVLKSGDKTIKQLKDNCVNYVW
jgi:hypothetical protein